MAPLPTAKLGTPTDPTVDLAAPVRGPCEAVDSPTTRVPSHGVHAWGPDPRRRPGLRPRHSSEPHLHIQAMDHPSVWIGASVPFTFDGRPVPPTGQALDSSAAVGA